MITTRLSKISEGIKTFVRDLKLSVTSVDFYFDVGTKYRGYGLKYIFVVSFIATVIYSVFFLYYLGVLREATKGNTISPLAATFDHAMKQLPIINYNGSSISIVEDTPFYVKNQIGEEILAIDPENTLSYSQKTKIPVVFGKNKINILLSDITKAEKGKKVSFTLQYNQLLGSQPLFIDSEFLKNFLVNLLSKSINVFTYLMMPLLFLISFILTLLDRSLSVFLIYVVTMFSGPKLQLQTIIRLVLFSSGVAILIQPFVVFLIPSLGFLPSMIQTLANLFLFLGIVKIRGR